MRFDVEAAMRDHARRREAEQSDGVVRDLVDLVLERRVLAAMMCDDEIGGFPDDADHRERALALCESVEVEDFHDLRHKAAMQALRNLQWRGEPTMPWHIADEISQTDRANEKHVSASVDLAFLMGIVLAAPSVSLAAITFARTRLRELANVRRLA